MELNTQAAVKECITKLASYHYGQDTALLLGTEVLTDHGDSLDHVELIMAVEDEMGVSIEDERAAQLTTIAALTRHVCLALSIAYEDEPLSDAERQSVELHALLDSAAAHEASAGDWRMRAGALMTLLHMDTSHAAYERLAKASGYATDSTRDKFAQQHTESKQKSVQVYIMQKLREAGYGKDTILPLVAPANLNV